MVAKAGTSKTSNELGEIAVEMLLELDKKYDLTNGELTVVVFLMQQAEQYSNEANHIQRKMEQSDG